MTLGLPAPEIEEVFGGVMVRLRSGGQTGGQIGGQIEVTERQQAVLSLIVAKPSISRAELAIQLQINESAIQKHIEKLKDKGILKRIGGTRGHWQINLP